MAINANHGNTESTDLQCGFEHASFSVSSVFRGQLPRFSSARFEDDVGGREADRPDAACDAARRRRRRAGTRRRRGRAAHRGPGRAGRRSCPASASPVPPLARPGLPVVLIAQRPSGEAQHAARALQHDVRVEALRELERGARCGRPAPARWSQPSSRAASPGCGVRIVGAVRAATRRLQRCRWTATAFSASASSTSGLALDDRGQHERSNVERDVAEATARAGTRDDDVGCERVVARRAASARARADRRPARRRRAGRRSTLPAPVSSPARAARSAAPTMPRVAADDAERAEACPCARCARAARASRAPSSGVSSVPRAAPASRRRRPSVVDVHRGRAWSRPVAGVEAGLERR